MSYREPYCKTTTLCFDVIFLSVFHLHSRSTHRPLLVLFFEGCWPRHEPEEFLPRRGAWRRRKSYGDDARPPFVLDTFVSKQADKMIRCIAILFYTGVLLHPLKPPRCEFLCFFFFLLTQFASDFSCFLTCSLCSVVLIFIKLARPKKIDENIQVQKTNKP